MTRLAWQASPDFGKQGPNMLEKWLAVQKQCICACMCFGERETGASFGTFAGFSPVFLRGAMRKKLGTGNATRVWAENAVPNPNLIETGSPIQRYRAWFSIKKINPHHRREMHARTHKLTVMYACPIGPSSFLRILSSLFWSWICRSIWFVLQSV